MSVGSVQVLNVQNKPALISLSTKYGSQCDSTLSDVTWTMQETISAADDNFTAVVNVHSMIFNNTFPNIITGINDKLKIASTWFNAGVLESYVQVITVPAGQYTVNTLIAYLNNLSVQTISTFSYGCSFGLSADGTKVTMISISGGTSGPLGIYNAAHVYSGFYLVADNESIPLMNSLGFLEFGQDGLPNNTSRVTQGNAINPLVYAQQLSGTFQGIGFPVFNGLSSTYYSYTSPWSAPGATSITTVTTTNVPELAGPAALSLSWEAATSNARESYNQLSTGNTIAIVPVAGAYGYRCIYEPNNPFRCVIPNFNVNQFKINVRDCETGNLVDFQGSDWVLNLVIEFYEMDNTHKSEQAIEGYYRNVMPNMHNTVLNHNLPHSGTSGYQKKRSRTNYIDGPGVFNPYQ